MQRLKGIAVTARRGRRPRGAARAPRRKPCGFPIPPERVESEIGAPRGRARARRACSSKPSRRGISRGPGSELAPLFDAQLLMLDDPMLLGRAEALVRTERVNAEWAVQRAFEEVEEVFDAIEDPYLRERKGDVADVVGRIRMNLRAGRARARPAAARRGPVRPHR